MAKYQCPDCGYVYDEVVGDPHEGFPAGTTWEKIPEDWSCPDCAVRDKVDFVALQEANPELSVSATNTAVRLPAKLRPREHRRKQRTHLLLQLKIKQSPKRNRSLPLQNRPKTRLKKIPIGSGSASLAAISTMKLSEMKPKASLPALVLKIFQTIGAVRTVVPQKRTMSSMKTSNPIENNNSLVRQEVIL